MNMNKMEMDFLQRNVKACDEENVVENISRILRCIRKQRNQWRPHVNGHCRKFQTRLFLMEYFTLLFTILLRQERVWVGNDLTGLSISPSANYFSQFLPTTVFSGNCADVQPDCLVCVV